MQANIKLIDQIHKHFLSEKDFEFLNCEDNEPTIIEANLIMRIERFLNPNIRDFRNIKVIQIATQTLKNLPRVSPSIAVNTPINDVCKYLLKKASIPPRHKRKLLELKIELTAYRLGIAKKDLDHELNQGFLEFASSPPLDRYLAEFDHKLAISENGEILILHNDQYVSWNLAQTIAKPSTPVDPDRFQHLNYGMNGVQNKNAFDFEELIPYKKENPENWGKKYIFEFCSCCENAPRFIGDHSWIRLKTPDGDIYSVGLYRPLNTKKSLQKDPLRIRKGLLMQPDISEFWPTPIHRIPFEITQEEFFKIKKQVEMDKKQDTEILEAFGKNCTEYAEKLGSLAGIKLPLKKPIWKLIAHKYAGQKIVHAMEFLQPKTPSNLVFISEKITSFFCSGALSLFGARKVDEEVHTPNQIKVKPKFHRLADLFNSEKCNIKHPHTLGHDAAKWVSEKRNLEIEKLLKEKELIMNSSSSKEDIALLNQKILDTKFMKIS